jgi:hypothetical protein
MNRMVNPVKERVFITQGAGHEFYPLARPLVGLAVAPAGHGRRSRPNLPGGPTVRPRYAFRFRSRAR